MCLVNLATSIIEFLNINSGAIQAFSTVVLVVITGVSVWLTGKTVRIMKKTEDERNRPRVIIYLQQRENWLNFVDLIIGNYGLDVARNIQFSSNGNLRLLRKGNTLKDLSVIKNGIKNLAPKQILKIPLLSLVGRVDELRKTDVVITVRYKDTTKTRGFTEKFPLDFNSLIEHQIGKPPIYEISEDIKKASKALERIDKKLK